MDEIKKQIDQHMKLKKYKLALPLIESELAQPYLPPGFAEIYHDYKKEIGAQQPVAKKHIEPEQCFDMMIQGIHPLVALSHLEQVPLVLYQKQIQHVFDCVDDQLIIGLLIQLCVQQQLTATFTLSKQGQRMEFMPMYVMSVEQSDGYVAIDALIKEVFENDNPSLMLMCQSLLMQEALLHLPLNLEEDDCDPYGFAIIKHVCLAMDDVQQWQHIKAIYHVKEETLQEISQLSTH